jgi:hypothetical protein
MTLENAKVLLVVVAALALASVAVKMTGLDRAFAA